MTSDTNENLPKIVLDTNILISAIGFGGKPRAILSLTLEYKVQAITSRILLAELEEVIGKKFPKLVYELSIIRKRINKKFTLVQPKNTLHIVRDPDDNRVLEAAVEGNCDYIVTGDIDLLEIKDYKNIKIVTPDEFLLEIQG